MPHSQRAGSGELESKTRRLRLSRSAQALSRADELFSHGRAIDHRYASDKLGLTVEYLPPEDPLWKKVWELHIRCHLTHYSGFVKIIESSNRTLAYTQ